ncbi:hypothetical protein AGLY_008741 [Aphis glycines]|uniref:Uncharacterized protein n=1 Tax=Aphis glycines TaxID=307491 RepID=A0A6G0TKB5_APHGL|nr:hypothetical protein AGLY_008741 [Aphis glycines]
MEILFKSTGKSLISIQRRVILTYKKPYDKGQKSTINYSIRNSQQSFLINDDIVLQFEDVIPKKKDLFLGNSYVKLVHIRQHMHRSGCIIEIDKNTGVRTSYISNKKKRPGRDRRQLMLSPPLYDMKLSQLYAASNNKFFIFALKLIRSKSSGQSTKLYTFYKSKQMIKFNT